MDSSSPTPSSPGNLHISFCPHPCSRPLRRCSCVVLFSLFETPLYLSSWGWSPFSSLSEYFLRPCLLSYFLRSSGPCLLWCPARHFFLRRVCIVTFRTTFVLSVPLIVIHGLLASRHRLLHIVIPITVRVFAIPYTLARSLVCSHKHNLHSTVKYLLNCFILGYHVYHLRSAQFFLNIILFDK